MKIVYIRTYLYIYIHTYLYTIHMSSLRVWVKHAAPVKPRVWRLAIFKELDLNDPFLVANISV